MTKFAFSRPNPTLQMKIRLVSESNIRLTLIFKVGQTLYCVWKWKSGSPEIYLLALFSLLTWSVL